MAVSGSITRRMGRLDKLWSPNSVNVPARAAANPLNKRMVVPELPQSSVADAKPCVPAITALSPFCSIRAPNRRMQSMVDRQSCPKSMPRTSALPLAAALNITARCVMLLSGAQTSVRVNLGMGDMSIFCKIFFLL